MPSVCVVRAAQCSQWKSPESVHAMMTAASEVGRGKRAFLAEGTGPKQKNIYSTGRDMW